MLDEKDLQAIDQLMAHRMNIILESEISPSSTYWPRQFVIWKQPPKQKLLTHARSAFSMLLSI